MTLKKTVIMAVALVLTSVILGGAIVAAQAVSNDRNQEGKNRPLEGDAGVGGKSQEDPASEMEGTIVRIVSNSGSNSYNPNPVQIKVGEAVTWINEDSSRHTATSGDGETRTLEGTFDSDMLRNGESFSFTFEEEGEYQYFCLLHPKMVGTVMVGAGDQ